MHCQTEEVEPMVNGDIVFPKFTLYHVAFVTRSLEEGMDSLRRTYGNPEFFVQRQAPIQTPNGMAYVDFALADLNGFKVEVIEPTGGHDGIYREALPQEIGATRFHHVASAIQSQQDWDQVCETIANHQLATPIGGRAETEQGTFNYVYVDMRRQLGHYLEFVYIS